MLNYPNGGELGEGYICETLPQDLKNETTRTYFNAYASTYVCDLQRQQAKEDSTQRSVVENPIQQDLNMSIEQKKQENIEAENQIKMLAENTPEPIAADNYNVSRAQEYAQAYVFKWNPVFGRFSSDCTNFASQIINYGGFPMVSGEWQWNGNEAAKRNWNVANDFTTYWALIRGYVGTESNSGSKIQSFAQPGDCLAYKNRESFNIWHVVFVQSKSNGNLYITQHTDDMYNAKWMDIFTNKLEGTDSVIVVDFTK